MESFVLLNVIIGIIYFINKHVGIGLFPVIHNLYIVSLVWQFSTLFLNTTLDVVIIGLLPRIFLLYNIPYLFHMLFQEEDSFHPFINEITFIYALINVLNL